LDQESAEGLLQAKVLALQMGSPLPTESLVARFNSFFDDGFLRIGVRLQFAGLSRQQTPHSTSSVAQFHRSVDHADAHSSASVGRSHCPVRTTGGSLDFGGSAGN
jgi:hypothetical protein